MKKISIVSPCYNEEQNIEAIYNLVKDEFSKNLRGYTFEHIFIDNFSTDETVSILRKIAALKKNVKIILGSISLLVAFFYFTYKIIYWDSFTVSTAPVVFGLFFFASEQLFF